MKVALLNPPWTFEHSIYFGCRAPHLPIELGASQVLLERAGHSVLLRDGLLDELDIAAMAHECAGFDADMIVVTTAPTYLFWRCAQPELRIPRLLLDALRIACPRAVLVVVGPHGSATPEAALRKLGADVVVRGECEEVVTALFDYWMDQPEELPQGYFDEVAEEGLARVVADYIAGMTDAFILLQYAAIKRTVRR